MAKHLLLRSGLITLALSQANAARAEVPSLTVQQGSFVERDVAVLGMTGELSGSVQVDLPSETAGVMIGDLTAKRGFPRLFISGIGAKDRSLCITLTSADGFYTATGLVHTSASARLLGEASVLLPSRSARMGQMMAGQVAALVRASAGNTCSASSVVLAFSWGTSQAKSSEAPKVLLAGAGNLFLPYIQFADQDEPSYCTDLPVNGGSRQSYRWVCEPPATACRPLGDLRIGWRYQGRSIEGPRIVLRRKCP